MLWAEFPTMSSTTASKPVGGCVKLWGTSTGPMARIRALVGWTPQCRDCLKVCEGRACSKADPLHIALLLTYFLFLKVVFNERGEISTVYRHGRKNQGLDEGAPRVPGLRKLGKNLFQKRFPHRFLPSTAAPSIVHSACQSAKVWHEL